MIHMIIDDKLKSENLSCKLHRSLLIFLIDLEYIVSASLSQSNRCNHIAKENHTIKYEHFMNVSV